MMKIITRKEYLADSKNLHQDYYMQFADRIPSWKLLQEHSMEEWDKLYEQDEHLNNVPLKFWDGFFQGFKYAGGISFKEVTGSSSYSISDAVCTAKAKMKYMIMNYRKKKEEEQNDERKSMEDGR